jgi:hypothetical protein
MGWGGMTPGRPVFTVTCSPGRDATVSVRRIGPGWLSLVLSMDPGRVVVDVPGVRGGAEVLARFCRLLAHEAAQLAATLDPGAQAPGTHRVHPHSPARVDEQPSPECGRRPGEGR